jgi:hypothetical protein
MKLYHLYVSGILYAELDFDTQPISIQKLDIASGKLLPWETLSEEDNAFYKSFTKIDLLKLSHQLHTCGRRGSHRRTAGRRRALYKQ